MLVPQPVAKDSMSAGEGQLFPWNAVAREGFYFGSLWRRSRVSTCAGETGKVNNIHGCIRVGVDAEQARKLHNAAELLPGFADGCLFGRFVKFLKARGVGPEADPRLDSSPEQPH